MAARSAVETRFGFRYGGIAVCASDARRVCRGEWFALRYFDDARFGLEAYAEAVGKIYDVQLLPQTSGLCTWYMDCQARRLRLETKDVSPRPLLLQRITILGQ